MTVVFPENAEDSKLKYAVILAKYNGKYVFVKHRERETLDLSGGHREAGENIAQTAARELYEETGASKYSLRQIGLYKINNYGMLFYAEITELGELPQVGDRARDLA